jgi:hypothetical protein
VVGVTGHRHAARQSFTIPNLQQLREPELQHSRPLKTIRALPSEWRFFGVCALRQSFDRQ